MSIHIGTALSCHLVWHWLISFAYHQGQYVIRVRHYGPPHWVCNGGPK